MKHNKVAAHGQVACIFCGNTPTTEEHIFSRRIKKIIPTVGKHRFFQFITNFSNDFSSASVQTKKFQIHPLNQTLKIVCGPCNNGWMNNLEMEAMPLMKPLILNQSASINSDQQRAIARWAVLKTIIAEYTDLPTKGVAQEDIKELYATKEIPEGWKVWIAKIDSPPGYTDYHHAPMTILPVTEENLLRKEELRKTLPPNTQFSVFIIQNLLIYTYRSLGHINYEPPSFLAVRIYKIFPATYTSIDWQRNTVLLGRGDLKLFRQVHFLFSTSGQ